MENKPSTDAERNLLPSRNTVFLPILVLTSLGFMGLALLWASFTDGASTQLIGYTILLTVGFAAIVLGTFSIAFLRDRRKKKLDE